MYRPEGHKIRCDFIHCYAGMGLAGAGLCSARGIWWHPACPAFKSEEQFEEEKNYRKRSGWRGRSHCGKRHKERPLDEKL